MRQIKSAFGFLTIIPFNESHSLREIAQNAWLFPIVGVVIGLIAGLFGQIASLFLPWSIASAIGLLSLLALTGFHHLDGLLDFGDALLIRGSTLRKKEVIHTPSIGTGAFGLGIFVILLTYLSISLNNNLIAVLIIAECSAKASMLVTTFIGAPAWKGMGSEFIIEFKKDKKGLIFGIILFTLLISPLAMIKTPLIIITVFIFSYFMAKFSNRLLGGITGDILGATNEITRMIVLVILL